MKGLMATIKMEWNNGKENYISLATLLWIKNSW